MVATLGATVVPTLVNEANDFATEGLPNLVEDITKGRGRLGFLQERYEIVDRVREAVATDGLSRLLGISGAAVAITKGVITAVIAVITIAVLTFFMLLEGPAWIERFFSLLPTESEQRWRRVGRDIYRTVGGFVTGALTIALVAGILTTLLLTVLGVQYAFALGLLVALLDLIPLAGATIAAVVVSTVAFFDDWRIGVAVLELLHRLPAGRESLPVPADLLADGAVVSAGDPDRRPDRRLARGRARRAGRDSRHRHDPGAPPRLPPSQA